MNVRLTLVCAGFCFATLVPGASPATPPDQQPGGAAADPGSDFVPQGGYHRTVELLRFRREAGLPGLGMMFAPGVNLQLSGVRSVPVVCVEFANRTHVFETEQYQELLFDPVTPPSPPRPTFTQYYRDVSGGQFIPTGEVFGWYQAPENDSFYEGTNNGRNQILGQLLRFAFEQADAEVDFGQFDNDGPDGLPNSGDDDGLVDTIFVIHPERGGECRNNDNIWSHSWQYSNFAAHDGPFQTDDIRLDAAGQPMLGSDRHIKIDDYTIQPGQSCASTPGSPEIVPIGVFCHEYGHALGLPDLYDRTPAGGPDSEGVGNYCLMAGGSYGARGGNAAVPVHLSAWCKALLGWATIQPIESGGEIELEPVQERNLVYSLDVPGTQGREFFLLEFRDSRWADPFGERINWDREFDPAGLAIWHVDESVGESSVNWPFAPSGMGQNDHPSLPHSAGDRFRDPHALVALIQRDGRLHLERNDNRFDDEDLYIDGTTFGDDPTLRAGSRSYRDGQPTGIEIAEIDLQTRSAVVSLDAFPSGHQPSPEAVAATPSDDDEADPETAERSGEIAIGVAVAPAPPAAIRGGLDEPLSSANAAGPQLALQRLSTKAMRISSADAFSKRDLKELAQFGPHTVRAALPPKVAQQVLTESAQQRTVTVSKNAELKAVADQPVAESAQQLANKVAQWIKPSTKGETVQVRFDADQRHVERIAEIRIPMQEASVKQDADRKLDEVLPLLAEPEVQLDRNAKVSDDGAVTYQQTVLVDGNQIPLHCNRVRLYYEDGALVGVESNLIDPKLITVTGKASAMTNPQLAVSLGKMLGVSPERVRIQGNCLHLVNDHPANARLATRVTVDMGAKQEPIEILVDGSEGKIVEMR